MSQPYDNGQPPQQGYWQQPQGYGQQPPSHPGAQPQYGGQPHYGQPAPTAGRNPMGLASLIVGAVPSVLGIVFLIAQAAVFRSGETEALGAISGLNSVLSAILALAAIVLGIVAVTRRGLSKTLAAAGIALGAATLVSVLSGLIYTAALSAFYG